METYIVKIYRLIIFLCRRPTVWCHDLCQTERRLAERHNHSEV